MATAFYGTITIRINDGTIQSDRFDSTDVDKAYVTWTSAGGETVLTVLADGHIVDLVLNITSAGTTKDFKVFMNQRDTNIYWVQSANFPTVDNRFTNLAPIPVTKGTRLQIQALA